MHRLERENGKMLTTTMTTEIEWKKEHNRVKLFVIFRCIDSNIIPLPMCLAVILLCRFCWNNIHSPCGAMLPFPVWLLPENSTHKLLRIITIVTCDNKTGNADSNWNRNSSSANPLFSVVVASIWSDSRATM